MTTGKQTTHQHPPLTAPEPESAPVLTAAISESLGIGGGKPSAKPSSTPRPAITPGEIRTLKAQIIATFLDLPSLCPVRQCRRRGRCEREGAPCLLHHWGFAEERLYRLVMSADP